MSLTVLVAAVSVLVRALAARPASARAPERLPGCGCTGACPTRYDCVLIERFGPTSARMVLVLVPGTTSGAGAFTFVARDLVRRVWLQVWPVERREQALEDTSVLERGDPDESLAYCLQRPCSGALHRHSVGAPTSHATFHVTASAFATAWQERSGRPRCECRNARRATLTRLGQRPPERVGQPRAARPPR